MMDLRPYQEDAVRSVIDGWSAGERSRLIVAPTGSGKTVMMADTLTRIVAEGGRVLILAHRNELITQAQATFESFGFKCAIEKGKDTAGRMDRVVISSMQTMAGKRRLKFRASAFTHIFVDEAHHIMSNSYQSVIDHFPDARILGVTATPTPLSMDFFDGDFSIDRSTLEAEGFLAKPLIRKISLAVDLTGAKLSADRTRIADSEAGERIDPHLRELARLIPETVGSGRGVVFLPLVATSKRFKEIAAEEGLVVEHVDGTTSRDDREAAYERVRTGKSQILSNSNLLTEGFDLPSLEWVCVLRPVLSPVYYEQAVGRAARIAPGKTHFTILDPLFLSERHVLGALDMMVDDPDLVEEMQLEDKTYDADDIAELAELSEADLRAKREENRLERERKIAEELQTRGRVAKKIGPLSLAAKLRPEDPAQRPTKQQFGMMKRMKIKWAGEQLGWDPIETKAQAGRVLHACITRAKAGLASPAVVAMLATEIRSAIEDGRADREQCVARWSDVRTMSKAEIGSWLEELKQAQDV
jgi:superfamily II DNA or RNA helicase